jgi:hypothetical protein
VNLEFVSVGMCAEHIKALEQLSTVQAEFLDPEDWEKEQSLANRS